MSNKSLLEEINLTPRNTRTQSVTEWPSEDKTEAPKPRKAAGRQAAEKVTRRSGETVEAKRVTMQLSLETIDQIKKINFYKLPDIPAQEIVEIAIRKLFEEYGIK